MKKIKIVIVSALISVSLLSLIACESKIDRELREMEETHNAISEFAESFGIELPEFRDTSGSVMEVNDEDSQVDTNYTLFPIEIILDNSTNLNKHIGKRYYLPALVVEVFDDHSGQNREGYELLLFHEDLNDEILEKEGWDPFFSFSIVGSDSQGGWRDIEYNESYIFCFEYLGYDELSKKHLGNYETHSFYDMYG
jgi:NDP-sugar pyrophosphorylase family protein